MERRQLTPVLLERRTPPRLPCLPTRRIANWPLHHPRQREKDGHRQAQTSNHRGRGYDTLLAADAFPEQGSGGHRSAYEQRSTKEAESDKRRCCHDRSVYVARPKGGSSLPARGGRRQATARSG